MIRWFLLGLSVFALLGVRHSYIDLRHLTEDVIVSRQDIGLGYVHKFGAHTDIDAVEETIYEGASLPALAAGPPRIIFDTTAQTLFISSDNAGDTEIVTVEGLDANFDAISVNVTLAGLTFTQIGDASNWMRVNRAFNTSTTTALVGDIYIHIDSVDAAVADGIPDTPATDIRTVIIAAEDQTEQAAYTVPDGRDAFLTEWCSSTLVSGGNTNAVTLQIRQWPGGSNTVERLVTVMTVPINGTVCKSFQPPLFFDARTAIEVTAESSSATGNVDVDSSFDLILTLDDE